MRITAPLAKAAHVVRGTPVTVEVVPEGFLVRVGDKPRLSLAQKLAAFDRELHGSKAMAGDGRVGAEVF